MYFSRVLLHIYGCGMVACAIFLVACEDTAQIQSAEKSSPPDAEKNSRAAASLKLDSHLVMALKKSRGEPPFDKPTTFDPDLAVDAQGMVMVDFQTRVTPGLLDQIRTSGGQVINHFEAMNAVRARVPLLQVETLAALPEVRFISTAAQATTNASSAAAAGGNLFPPDSVITSDPPAKHEN